MPVRRIFASFSPPLFTCLVPFVHLSFRPPPFLPRRTRQVDLPAFTDEEVERAAKLANAHEFISKFPEGYVLYLVFEISAFDDMLSIHS